MYNVKRQYYTSDKNSFKCMVTMKIQVNYATKM